MATISEIAGKPTHKNLVFTGISRKHQGCARLQPLAKQQVNCDGVSPRKRKANGRSLRAGAYRFSSPELYGFSKRDIMELREQDNGNSTLVKSEPILTILPNGRVSLIGQTQRRQIVGSRVVFLDIDGVVNRTAEADQVIVVPELVARLKDIVESPVAAGKPPSSVHIVLSTFWRPFMDYIAYILDRHGIDGSIVVSVTPGRSKHHTCIQRSSVKHMLHEDAFHDERHFPNRASEIRQFLKLNPQVERFVILDDREDAADGELCGNFLRTNPEVGLTESHVARARKLLQ